MRVLRNEIFSFRVDIVKLQRPPPEIMIFAPDLRVVFDNKNFPSTFFLLLLRKKVQPRPRRQ
jgi:hypothetical protein